MLMFSFVLPESNAYPNGSGTLNPELCFSGCFKLLHAAGESGIERLGILMSDGRNVSVTEAVPALHILNGSWKRPSRHERIIEAHQQVRDRHHLLQSEELRGRRCCGKVVEERGQTFANLRWTQVRAILARSKDLFKSFDTRHQIWNRSSAMGGNDLDLREAVLGPAEDHIGKHAGGVEHELQNRYVDAEINGARCLGWDWVDKQGDATAVHLLKPWVVTRVSKVDVIDARRGRDAVKLQRIECIRHLYEKTVCRRQRR